MKKTLSILTLTAICGALAGATETSGADYSIAANFTVADGAPSSVTAGSTYVPNVNVATGGTLDLTGITLSASGEDHAAAVSMTNYSKGILFAANNVGSRGTVTYTISFTAGADYSLTELKLAFLTFNGYGKNHTAQPVFSWSVSLNDSEIGANGHQATTTTSANQTITSTPVYSFDTNAITNGSGAIVTLDGLDLALRQGGAYSLTVAIADDETSAFTSGYFVGLGGFSMKGTDLTLDEPGQIPEPTTATLSLLALAALSARRRRR